MLKALAVSQNLIGTQEKKLTYCVQSSCFTELVHQAKFGKFLLPQELQDMLRRLGYLSPTDEVLQICKLSSVLFMALMSATYDSERTRDLVVSWSSEMAGDLFQEFWELEVNKVLMGKSWTSRFAW